MKTAVLFEKKSAPGKAGLLLNTDTLDTLDESFKLHDKYQLEMKFTYPLNPDSMLNSYHVDTYIFLPNSLGITPLTYSKEDFYADLQEYIRLKTPAVLLRGMNAGEGAPLNRLEETMRRYSASPHDPELAEAYQERLKMFCSIMKSALRDEEAFLERSSASLNFETLIRNYLDRTVAILEAFRGTRLLIEAPGVAPIALEIFRFVDEYLSLTANKYRCKLWVFLNTSSTFSWTVEMKRKIVSLIRYEIEYRKANQYPSIPAEDSENDALIYRAAVLKKVMASVLFLKTTVRRDGVLMENLLFGIAAGVAMAFATVVSFVTAKFFYSELSLLVFAVVVLSYMGKDRIKELLRHYFQTKMRRYLYDYKTKIQSGFGKEVGVCREGFLFVREDRVDPRILKIRNRDTFSLLANEGLGETVLLARKHVSIFSKNCKNLFADFKVDGIVDIMRLNIRRFLWKMDNPAKELFLPDDDGETIRRITGKRLYHVNIVIRYGMLGREDRYTRYRIILGRNGIRQIVKFPEVTLVDQKV